MNDSMAQPQPGLANLELPGWKSAINVAAAFLLALLFLSSGIWKITDVPAWAVRLVQAKVPEWLSLAGALGGGIAETVAGGLLVGSPLRGGGGGVGGRL